MFHVYVGEFATSLEMAGASISLLKLDTELEMLLSKARHGRRSSSRRGWGS